MSSRAPACQLHTTTLRLIKRLRNESSRVYRRVQAKLQGGERSSACRAKTARSVAHLLIEYHCVFIWSPCLTGDVTRHVRSYDQNYRYVEGLIVCVKLDDIVYCVMGSTSGLCNQCACCESSQQAARRRVTAALVARCCFWCNWPGVHASV